MLSVPVLLAVLAIAVQGRPQMAVHEQGKRCSQWMTRSEVEDLRSTDGGYKCAGRSAIERRGFHVRTCCLPSAALRSEASFPTECGKQQFEPHKKRVVGGSEAIPNSWPWQIHLQANGALCGGSLIDTRYVLTAAHCISSPSEPEKYTVLVGKHDYNEPVGAEHAIVAEQIFVHEQYDPTSHANDIAIIRLSQPVQISEIANVICLPGPEANAADDTVWVVGWGRTQHEGEISMVLKQAALHPMSDVCERVYGDSVYNNEKEMCAGFIGGGHGSCQGDSGGPLMYESAGTWYLNGVVSRGIGCAFDGFPTIYTRVSYYLPWIYSIIG